MADQKGPKSPISSSTPQEPAAVSPAIILATSLANESPKSWGDLRSRSSSVWSAPSPNSKTGALSSSKKAPPSPSLPPLPRFLERNLQDIYKSPPQGHPQGSDNSSYYTALWGSPYDHPSSLGGSQRSHRRRSTNSTITAGSSPLKNQVTGGRDRLPRQRPSDRLVSNSYANARQAGFKDLKKHRYSSTQDWLKSSLAERRKSEKENWLSDDSEESNSDLDSEADFGRDSNHWLDLDDEDSFGVNEFTVTNVGQIAGSSTNHRLKPSDSTLRQENFDAGFQLAKTEDSNMLAAMIQGAVPRKGAGTTLQKPLPPPPNIRTNSEAPITTTAESVDSPGHTKRLSTTSGLSFQRPKKRLVWRGKTCVIALPLDEGHRKSRTFLSSEDVARNLLRLEEQGLSTQGFDLEEESQGQRFSHGQSRALFPDPLDTAIESRRNEYRVRIPDRKAWQNYVNQLQEEKLRALGVSFGAEKVSARKSPALPMSRQESTSTLPLGSKPTVPLSANNFRGNHDDPFSPPLSYPSSVVSPGPQQLHAQGGTFHMPRQSLAFPHQQAYGLGNHYSPQPTPPINDPRAQHYFPNLPNSRGVSPLLGGMQNTLSSQSPVSPMMDPGFDSLHQARALPPHLRRQMSPLHVTNQSFHMGLPGPQSNRPNIVSEFVRRNSQPISYHSQPEIASPLPQGHRQNLSATLQKEIDDAEYHLEESIRRQLEEENDELSLASTREDGEPAGEMIKSPKENEVDATLDTVAMTSQPRVTVTEINSTNPAIEASTTARKAHGPRPSVSKLNVNAQEFQYDPTKSFTPSMFSFGASPSTVGPSPMPSATLPAQGLYSQATFKGSASGSSLNVAAPAFTPGMRNNLSPSTREFSFSSQAPKLKPDAPPFTPRGFDDLSDSLPSAREPSVPRIFSTFDFTNLHRPAKPSNAIPIMKPSDEPEYLEDEFGRPTQAEGRQKRLRQRTDSGDQIPLFASPTQDTVPRIVDLPIGDLLVDCIDVHSEKKLTSPTAQATDQLKSLLDGLHESAHTSVEGDEMEHSSIVEEKIGTQIATSPIATNNPDANDTQPNLDFKAQEILAPSAFKKPALSPMAKPFEYNPTITSFQSDQKVQLVVASETLTLPKSMGSSTGEVIESLPKDVSSGSVTAKLTPMVLEKAPATSKPLQPARSGLGASRFAQAAVIPKPTGREPAKLTSPKASVAITSDISKSKDVLVEEPSSAAKVLEAVALLSEESKTSTTTSTESIPIEKTLPTARTRDSHVSQPDTTFEHTDQFTEPSDQELDAVMRELNGEDSDIGVERVMTPHTLPRNDEPTSKPLVRRPSPHFVQSPQLIEPPRPRETPTASPNKLSQPFQYLPPDHDYGSSESAVAELVARNARFSPSFRPSRRHSSDAPSPIHRLNRASKASISDWDDVVSSGEEAKFLERSRFFGERVDDLVGRAIHRRLFPIEQNLDSITASLARLVSRSSSQRNGRSASVGPAESDADDEDDDSTSQARNTSPIKDRRLEKLKASLLESITAHMVQQSAAERAGREAMMIEVKASLRGLPEPDLLAAVAELRNSIETHHAKPAPDLGAIVNDVFESRSKAAAPEAEQGESKRKLAELELLLQKAHKKAEHDSEARCEVESRLVESENLLRLAQSEACQHQETMERASEEAKAQQEELHHFTSRNKLLEDTVEMSRNSILQLTRKNTAMDDTLKEYRISHKQWRDEMDGAKIENRNLDRTVHALKLELQESIHGRHALREKFTRLQDDIQTSAHNLARDASIWRRKEVEYKARSEHQNARLGAEARTRERLECEIERLEAQEKEAMKARFLVEQVQIEKTRLNDLVGALQTANRDYQEKASLLDRELFNAKEAVYNTNESARMEVERLQGAMEMAKHAVQAEYQILVTKLESRLEIAHNEASTASSRHQLMLEEAAESKNTALREAAEAREAALQEHYRFHERAVEEMKSLHERALASAVDDHRRVLQHTMAEKAMLETQLSGRLALAEQQVVHYQDRVAHLEDKLEIAKSAGQAAIQAAQNAKAQASPATIRTTATFSRGSDVPEKISPQALRESILVLQEQLQARETQIEALESELAQVDKDAPTKIKDRDAEISWLRELLGLRIDDLQDIITTLSSPILSRDAIRDAVIRLRTSLQMEQQERERAMATGGNINGHSGAFSSLASIAASPRNLPLAAAAAWGSWRRGQASLSSLAEMVPGATNPSSSSSQTPTRSSSPSFLSGLLTPPPSTSLRTSPQGISSRRQQLQQQQLQQQQLQQQERRRPLAGYSTPKRQISASSSAASKGLRLEPPPPETPPLLRREGYDRDAKDGHYSLARYVADEESVIEEEPDRDVDQDTTDGADDGEAAVFGVDAVNLYVSA